MGLLGAVLGWRRWRELMPIYFLIVSVTGGYALLTACTRFRLPLDPFLIILSSLAATKIAQALPLARIRLSRVEPAVRTVIRRGNDHA